MKTLIDEMLLQEFAQHDNCKCQNVRSSELGEILGASYSNTPQPGAYYRIQYKQGGLLTTAGRAYNTANGGKRLEYAIMINNHPQNRRFWVQPYDDFTRRYFPNGIISFNPQFTCNIGNQRFATSSEQKCFASIWIPPHPNTPENNLCGVPVSGQKQQLEMEREAIGYEWMEFESPSPSSNVKPRLSFYLDDIISSAKNHFLCQAGRLALKISAFIAPVTQGKCDLKIGATPYASGADIVNAITNAGGCQKLEMIHIFGHGHKTRISGNLLPGFGLLSSQDPNGKLPLGRFVTDIPTSALSDNIIFVIHNCNCARDTGNLAEEMYGHFVKSLKNPKVFGHYEGGCAGRNNQWKEYSKQYPKGKILQNLNAISPAYAEGGCCGK